jgi:hypothetical protein
MFKIATLTAAVAANTQVLEDFDEFEKTMEMFKVTVHEKEMQGLEKHGKALETESQKYEQQIQNSKVGEVFSKDFQDIAKTPEVADLAKYIETLKKNGPTAQMKKFERLYQAQMNKVEMAHRKMQMHAQQNSKEWGNPGDRHATVNIDNDYWYQFNAEYYKLREMEYYAQYKIPEVVELRKKVTAVTKTVPFQRTMKHWQMLTTTEQHQVVVKHQAKLLIEAIKCIHIEEGEEKWVDPKKSPVMFEVWHAVYLYFVAVGKGELQPMLDFMIDGKYDETFAKEVNPDFGRPEEHGLYLF